MIYRASILIVNPSQNHYILPMNRLTKREQMVLCIVLGLLLTGWAVKAYRATHGQAQSAEQSQH